MAYVANFAPTTGVSAIPLRDALPWVVFAGLICLLGVYFVGAEQDATSSSRACMCTNSCTTAAICSASPATDGFRAARMTRVGISDR